MAFVDFNFDNLNTNFYKFDRERLLKTTPINKRLSSGSIDYNIIDPEEFLKTSIKYLTKFSLSLFHYITEESTPNVNLTFNTDTSYCDLLYNKVVININYLTNKDLPFQLRVDSILGLIFHEYLHKRVTITSIALNLKIPRKEYYNETNKFELELWVKKNIDSNSKKHIFNILEDFRIEKLGIKVFPGYGFFLDELRKFAFYHLSNRFDNLNLKLKKSDPENKFSFYLLDYLMIVILMPELREDTINKITSIFDSHSNPKLLIDYNKFINEVDSYIKLNGNLVYSDQLKDILIAVNQLDKILKKYAKDDDELKNKKPFNMGNPYLFGNNFNTKDISDEIKDFLIEINQDLNDNLDPINKSDCIIEKIYDNKGFTRYNEIKIYTEAISNIDSYICKEADKYSKDICRNLGFLSSRYNRINQEFELAEGDLDEDELYSIGYNKNIFYDENNIQGYELDFGYLLDESASMAPYMTKAKIACLTITKSLHKEKHINLYGYGHTANDNKNQISLFKYYNSKENFTNINTIYSATERTNNADGFAIEKMCEIMSKSKAKKKVLVVISDGMPHAINYFGKEAIEHTHNIVKKYESQGFYIVQICMNNIEESAKMFSNYIPYQESHDFIKKFKSILIRELRYFHNQI